MKHPIRLCSKTALLAGAAFGLAIALPARAADVTADQAAALERQVRDALGGLLGPSVKISDRPIKVTPAGDHFDVVVPFPYTMPPAAGAPANAPPQTLQATATAKQGESGVWLIEGLRVTTPLRFRMEMEVPGTGNARPRKVPVLYTIEQTGQDGRIVWDPTFATPSTWTTSSKTTSAQAEGGPVSQKTSVGPVTGVTTLRPAGGDRVDVLMDGTMQDYRISSDAADTPIDAAIQRVRASGSLNGVSRARALALTQLVASSLSAVLQTPSGTVPGAPKMGPEAARAVLQALQDFASDFAFDETMDGFVIKASGQTVALEQMKLGIDAKSDAGMLRAGLTMGVQGIVLPDLPLGDMAALIPRRIALHPVVGGVAVADLLQLLKAASENREPSQAEIAALFSKGGITGGLESLAVEVGGATFTGQAKLVAAAPDPNAITGTAQLTAENFDALTQKVQSIPSLAQAIPVIVFIKGVGRTVDNKMVWDIVYKDSKVLVNNVDLTAMTGGSASPAPAPRPPREPARPPVPSEGARKAPAPRVQGQTPSWAK